MALEIKDLIRGKDKKAIKEIIKDFSEDEIYALLYDWEGLWAREKQLEPKGDWSIWLVLAGRGFGKTRTGAEWVRKNVEEGKARRIALVAPTAADARDVMVEGPSGILNVFPPNRRPLYEPSKRRITFYNGAIAITYSADEPERLRGPEHDLAWLDELCAWRYRDSYDNLMFGLRAGENPRAIITTTPKPIKLLKEIMEEPTTVITRGSTYENRANLARSFLNKIISKYKGTRLGRQELMAEILDDTPGALWNRDLLEKYKVKEKDVGELVRLAVSIDPAITSHKDSDETGIIVGGVGIDKKGYVLEDLSGRYKPYEWARIAVNAYYEFKADCIIAESNQGGEMVSYTIKTIDDSVPVRLVHASRGKQARAEPISALYEQGKIYHVGYFAELEDQMCTWVPGEGESPDRVDALVHLFTYLMLKGRNVPKVAPATLSNRSTWRV